MILRPAVIADAAPMCALLNRIIAIGGTTAHELPMTPDQVAGYYITGSQVICCHVAEMDGAIIGFQSVERSAKLPEGWGDIGTFVSPDCQRSGAGAALFSATQAACRAAGLPAINATIRADNAPGLGYYARRGFVDYATDPGFALRDGRVVGRISRRFDL